MHYLHKIWQILPQEIWPTKILLFSYLFTFMKIIYIKTPKINPNIYSTGIFVDSAGVLAFFYITELNFF